MRNRTVHWCIQQEDSRRGTRADSTGHQGHASSRWVLRCRYGLSKMCNPLRHHVHPCARPVKQAMDGLSTFAGPERRSRIRFPIALNARYAVVGRQDIEGTCRTMNISSHGALITSGREWSPGMSVSVVIEWPILLGSVRPLALHIHGKVIRSDHGLVALRFLTYELRTQPRPRPQVKGLPEWRARGR
jgi:PilZ domain